MPALPEGSAAFDLGQCAEMEEKVQRLADGELRGAEADELRAHIEGCEGCRRFHDALSRARDEVRDVFRCAKVPAMPTDLVACSLQTRSRRRRFLVAAIPAAAAAAVVTIAAVVLLRVEVRAATVAWTMGEVAVVRVDGSRERLRPSDSDGASLARGDRIECAPWSGAELNLAGGSSIVVDGASSLSPGDVRWHLSSGRIVVDHPDGAPGLAVATPEALVSTRGTKFEVRRLENLTATLVRSGSVEVRAADDGAAKVVESGHEGTIAAGGKVAVRRAAMLDAPAASGGRGGVLLRYRFGAGDGWRWHLERSMRFEAHRGDGLAMLARAFLGGAEEVSASADVDFAVEEVTSGARSAVRVGPAGAGVLIEADPLGRRRIIASQGGGRLAEALRPERGFHFAAAELAPRMALGPVRPGEAWKHSAKGTVLKARGGRLVLKLDLLIEYRLADQQPAGRGGREVVIEQKVVRRDFELVDAERGRALVTARSTGSGRAVFDPLAGALMSSELELRTTFSPGGLGKGRRLGEISYTETISQRLATDGR